ncbi:capsid assembly protein [Achromobacter aegrifaciens]
MIAAYDRQFTQHAPAPAAQAEVAPATQAQTAPQQQLPSDQSAAPKLTDEPKVEGEKPTTDEPKTDEKPSGQSLGDLYVSGDLVSGFNAETVPDNVVSAFKAAGLDDDAIVAMHAQFRAGQLALQREQVGNLHQAAGGKDQFDALVAWGQKNLSQAQREYYDAELNGPNAAEAIAVLRQRMNAGQDPKVVLANTTAAPAVQGFRDKFEMQAAMSDPRYKISEAFRNDVRAKLAASRF